MGPLGAGDQRDGMWVPAPGGIGNRSGQNLLGLCIQLPESVEFMNHSLIHPFTHHNSFLLHQKQLSVCYMLVPELVAGVEWGVRSKVLSFILQWE